MKKILLFLGISFCSYTSFAQSVPNGGFENWTANSFETPQYYFSSNFDHGGLPPYSVLKTSDAKSGTYAVLLETFLNGIDTANAFVANGDPSHPAGQGVPYTEQATGLTGYYKGTFINNDSSIVWVIFKKSGVVIGNYMYHIGTNQNNYTQFNFTFTPALPMAPDSMIIALTSSNLLVNKGVPGTFVQYDSIAFTGVAAQPANFNGDFELWSTQVRTTLNQWQLSHVAGQTNDKYSGNYALELRTENDGNNGPSQASATNGKSNPGGTNGGSPYSTQVDTLVFYYKFMASDANDSGRAIVQFKNAGITFQTIGIVLKDTASYKRVEVPFNLPSAPDTVLFFFNSTRLSNNIPTSYLGGTLRVDNMFFKSQQVPVSAFLVPANGCVNQPVQLSDNSDNLPNAWAWSLTGGTPDTSNLQNPIVTYTSTGTYTIGLMASNAFGDGAFVTQIINISNVPVVSVTSPTMCAGDSAIVVASGASTYLWSNLVANDSIKVFPSATTNYTVTGSANGCSASATATVTVINCTTAIADVKSQASIYPNPGTGMITINSEKELGVVELYSTLGELVYREKVNASSVQLDITKQAAGVYTVLIQGKRLKLVKE